MRAADGRTSDVYVAEGIYELAKLKAGDKIRVDFALPDEQSRKPSAASVWPVK